MLWLIKLHSSSFLRVISYIFVCESFPSEFHTSFFLNFGVSLAFCHSRNGILGRLYANVLLASLNGRERARTRLTASRGKQSTNDFQLTAAGFSSNASHTRTGQAPGEQMKCFPVVSVSTEVERHADYEIMNNHKVPSTFKIGTSAHTDA